MAETSMHKQPKLPAWTKSRADEQHLLSETAVPGRVKSFTPGTTSGTPPRPTSCVLESAEAAATDKAGSPALREGETADWRTNLLKSDMQYWR